ncbi:MAG: hypothetical protein H7222_13700 [Methylotenera sp.]|nr:hypothetical protein [Oligoflexia bacterium]
MKTDYTEDEIALSLDHLVEKGMLGSGDSCHSPMAYLAKAIAQVLPEAQAGQEKFIRAKNRSEELAEEEQVKIEQEAELEAEFLAREQAFVEAFPTAEAQAEVIRQCAERYPMLDPNGRILRNLTIAEWTF